MLTLQMCCSNSLLEIEATDVWKQVRNRRDDQSAAVWSAVVMTCREGLLWINISYGAKRGAVVLYEVVRSEGGVGRV